MESSKSGRFSIKKRLKSFLYACRGIAFLFRTQHNSWIHLIMAAAVIALGIIFRLKLREWLWISLAIGIVFTAELFNSAIEQLVDIVSPQYQEKAGKIKDLAAGAVLITALAAVIIGLVIFLPKIL